MAARIRRWRCDEDYSWRAVAQAACELWGFEWGSSQLFGRDLCAAAAKLLGETPSQESWN
ncbi:hypothetical protein ACWEVM_24700 [Streptomyces bauhiniae]|uniref:hypothetical protein n=1 Tax=Streptomyces bauhiniae TaxID=2340725 RepID=UPI003693A341